MNKISVRDVIIGAGIVSERMNKIRVPCKVSTLPGHDGYHYRSYALDTGKFEGLFAGGLITRVGMARWGDRLATPEEMARLHGLNEL